MTRRRIHRGYVRSRGRMPTKGVARLAHNLRWPAASGRTALNSASSRSSSVIYRRTSGCQSLNHK
jgi:hypothetical protein